MRKKDMADEDHAPPGREKAFAALNQDLLGAAAGQPAEELPPRRNTKDELIDKIEKLSAEQGIAVEQSKTKLRRMTKRQLAQLLARMIEEHVQNQVCDKAGVERGAPPNLVALGALRMVHDLAAGTREGRQRVPAQVRLRDRGLQRRAQAAARARRDGPVPARDQPRQQHPGAHPEPVRAARAGVGRCPRELGAARAEAPNAAKGAAQISAHVLQR